jgi:hypothetical protein
MTIYRSSVSVEATADATFAYLQDAAHLAAFVAAVEPGASPVGDWFQADPGRHPRVEWRSEPAHGWLEVDREGAVASITAEVNITAGGEDSLLDAALFSLKAAIEAG